ncbi:MAG: GNAT family N-acetyltransferase [Actinomycetota bacterium]|nr:GNAT family N-acetyltransferase [Actinomycetota bacterium]
MDLTIRRYDRSDQAAVLQLHRDGLEQMGADAGPGPWDADLDDIEHSYLSAGGDFVVGLIGAEVVAMGALLRVATTTADLKRLRVKRELQGKGIGEQVARFLIERAKELGFARLTADTTTRQGPAQQLLEKLDFVETRRQQFSRFELIYYERTLD